MGVVPGAYSFKAHLRWTPAVAAGFFASVLAHALVVGVG